MEDYASGYSYSCKACWKTSSQVINAMLIIALAVFILLLIAIIQYLIAKIPPTAGDSGHEFPALEMDRSALWVRSATKHLVGTVKIVLVVCQITTQVKQSATVSFPLYPLAKNVASVLSAYLSLFKRWCYRRDVLLTEQFFIFELSLMPKLIFFGDWGIDLTHSETQQSLLETSTRRSSFTCSYCTKHWYVEHSLDHGRGKEEM